LDLFGQVSAVASGGVFNAGRPSLTTRLMVPLLNLKRAFNESDVELIQRWGKMNRSGAIQPDTTGAFPKSFERAEGV